MSRAVKEAGAVGDFVAANKMPIATGATAMALAALFSKRNRLAKALGWGAVGAGLGKAGQLYLDAYKRPEGTVPEGSVPDYLKRQPAKAQEPVLNTDIPGVSPRVQAAIQGAKLPRKEAPTAEAARAARREQLGKEMAKMQKRYPGEEMLGETVRETSAILKDQVLAPYRDAKESIQGLQDAASRDAAAKKNIPRMEKELKRMQAERNPPVPLRRRLDDILRRALSK